MEDDNGDGMFVPGQMPAGETSSFDLKSSSGVVGGVDRLYCMWVGWMVNGWYDVLGVGLELELELELELGLELELELERLLGLSLEFGQVECDLEQLMHCQCFGILRSFLSFKAFFKHG